MLRFKCLQYLHHLYTFQLLLQARLCTIRIWNVFAYIHIACVSGKIIWSYQRWNYSTTFYTLFGRINMTLKRSDLPPVHVPWWEQLPTHVFVICEMIPWCCSCKQLSIKVPQLICIFKRYFSLSSVSFSLYIMLFLLYSMSVCASVCLFVCLFMLREQTFKRRMFQKCECRDFVGLQKFRKDSVTSFKLMNAISKLSRQSSFFFQYDVYRNLLSKSTSIMSRCSSTAGVYSW